MISSKQLAAGVVLCMKRLFFASALLLASCAAAVSEDARACPCAAGFFCCDLGGNRNVCLINGSTCAPFTDVTPPAAPSLSGTVPPSPANQVDVEVLGVAEAGARVDLFARAGCQGTAAGTGTADQAGQFRIAIQIAPDSATAVSARATDQGGNTGPCTAQPFEVVHDDQPPAAPTLTSLLPAPLSNSLTPTVGGTAEPAATVTLYSGTACEQALTFSGRADAAGRFQITAQVDPDTVTQFSARAADAAGNLSGCSAQSLRFEHDDLSPPAPGLSGTTPKSPSPNSQPRLLASAEAGSTVQIFTGPGCTGAPFGAQTAAADGAVSFLPIAALNTANLWSLRAIDRAGNASPCSASQQYIHDNVPPAPAALSMVIDPPGPSPSPTFTVSDFALSPEPGETVEITATAQSGRQPPFVVVVPVVANGAFQATIPAFPNDVANISVRTLDAAGNAASSQFMGTEVSDATPPPAPTVLAASVPTPSHGDTAFEVAGQAEPGSNLDLWTDPACTAALEAGLSPLVPQTGNWRRAVAVPAAASTDIYATATDQAGNRSACSAKPFTFTNTPAGQAWDRKVLTTDHVSDSVVLDSRGGAFALQTFSPDFFTFGASLVLAQPGGGWVPAGTVFQPSSLRSQFAMVLEDDQPLMVYSLATNAPLVQMHSTTRNADGTFTADETFSTHPSPAEQVNLLSLAPDRAGGAWAAWVVLVFDHEELWAAHHTRSGGWTAPIRLASPGEVQGFGVAAGRSGHAALIWQALQFPGSGTAAVFAAFFDPAVGWGAPEAVAGQLSGLGSAFEPIAMDDAGRAMAISYDPGSRVISARLHDPATGWANPVPGQPLTGELDQLRFAMNGAGDAALAWTVEPLSGSGPNTLFVQRYSAASGWHAAENLGTAGSLSRLSLAPDGSLWLLVNGLTPSLRFVDPGFPDPAWLQRFVPGTGWLAPVLVIGDGGGCGIDCLPELARNDAGVALVPWSTSSFLTFSGSWLAWFH